MKQVPQKDMVALSGLISAAINENKDSPEMGFVLLTFPINQMGIMRYISNTDKSKSVEKMDLFLYRNENLINQKL